MAGETVLLLGATGYIGGSILTALLALPSPPSKITCLIRDTYKADLLKTISTPSGTAIDPLIGSLSEASDAELIAKAAAEHEVVINAATADKEEWLEPVFAGIKRRYEETGRQGVFIHTSGTGMFQDNAMGMYKGDKVYTDVDSPDSPYLSITSIPSETRHRHTDLAIIPRDEEEGICRVYIVVPCHIWDYGQGEVFDKGISHNTTICFPWQVEESLKVKQAIMTGKGLNVWNHVHISDTAALYMSVYTQSLTDSIPHGSNGFYLACAGEYSMLDICTAIGEKMYDLGLAQTKEITTFAEDDTRYRVGFSGTNARGIGIRAGQIGWKAKYDKVEDLLAYVKREVRTISGAKKAE